MHAQLDAGRVQILTCRGNDWTDKYPAIANSIAGLPARNAYLDGELCGVLPDGRTAFNLIQNATDTGEGSLVFFLFAWTRKFGPRKARRLYYRWAFQSIFDILTIGAIGAVIDWIDWIYDSLSGK